MTVTTEQGLFKLTYTVVEENNIIGFKLTNQELAITSIEKGTALAWTDSTGKTHTIIADKDYKVNPDGSVDITMDYEQGNEHYTLHIDKLAVDKDSNFIVLEGTLTNAQLKGNS